MVKSGLGRIVGLGVVALCLLSKSALAGEMDLLLQKLVEKGVLSAGEAQQIATETREQVKKETAQGKNESLPQWIQTTKLKGDFRLRYQYDHSTGTSLYRNRGRIRLRLGVESKPNDKLLVGVGLATGLSDGSTDAARSTNVTFEKGFSKKPIALDYAFAQYMPFKEVTIIGGKMKNPFWEPGDLIWDTDINPEGGAVQLTKKLNNKVSLFSNLSAFVVGEDGTSNDDPMLSVFQGGAKVDITEKVALKTAFSYYMSSNFRGATLSGTTGTNTLAGGKLAYKYDFVSPAMELSFKDPFKNLGIDLLDVPYLSFFGEYVNNTAVKKNQSGQMVGLRFGMEKISAWKDWQFMYNYARLEKDAVPDILPDSDRYGGKTGIKAHEGVFTFGLGKNTYMNIDYYYGSKIASRKLQAPAQVVQVDWNLKF